MALGKRTEVDFSEHELIITKNDSLAIWELKIPKSNMEWIRFINVEGHLLVVGDYGDWVFCREFHPSASSGVSDSYWCEKIHIANPNMKCYEFDAEGTAKEIEELLTTSDNLTEDEIEYLNECKHNLEDGEFDYSYVAYRNNIGRFEDSEYVPYVKRINIQLQIVFDGFDEICRRLKVLEEK